MSGYVVSFYHFANVANPEITGQALKDRLTPFNPKGTILLSREGINSSLYLTADMVAGFELELAQIMEAKISFRRQPTEKSPFRRWHIRIKPEIITARMPVNPAAAPAPYIEPLELKAALDRGEEVILIDTRNSFELAFGSFRGAHNPGLKSFTDWERAVKEFPQDWKKKRVVTFCTGGIRCEKAAPYMEQQGFENVAQLKGGILGYFAAAGDAHYDGECFVFDERVAVGPDLRERETSFCSSCQIPLHDPKLRRDFGIRERYCLSCEDKVPEYLKKRWLAYHFPGVDHG